MSLVEHLSHEDNQRNQKSDQSHSSQQAYHHHPSSLPEEEEDVETTEEQQTTPTATLSSSRSTSTSVNVETTTSTSNNTVTLTSTSITLDQGQEDSHNPDGLLDFLSSPPSSSAPLMTSTPLVTTTSTTTGSCVISTNSKLVSENHTNNNHSSSEQSQSESFVTTSTKAVPVQGPISSIVDVQEDNHQSESQSSNLASSSSTVKETISTTDQSSDSSKITIIQVQSTTERVQHQVEEKTMSATATKIQTGNGVHMQETDLDTDIDGLAITRIKVTGGDPKSQNQTPTGSPTVKVTVLNGDSGQRQGHEVDPDRSTSVTPTNAEHEESSSRGPVRFDEGLVLGSSGAGVSGSQPSDLNDTVSEMSSVVNNPSVISALPDRYGFMGGEQYTHESEPDPSPEIVRRREMKWLQMMEKWDHFMRKDFKTVRSRCRKGIPRSVRGRAWYYLCGAAFIKKKDPDLYFRLLQQEGKPSDVEDIKKDLHRQFPWHEIFAEEGHGKKDLFNVLKAHSILNSKDGYCQAQAPVASILLMHMPAEDAFWCLVAICDKYLKGYYSPGMEQLQLDGDILFGLLKRVAPPVYKHMKKQKIDPVLYMTEWFLCAFTRTLPWSSVLRVWDSFLCEGVKVLFRVGLILLKYSLGRPGVLKQCPSMYETLSMLKNLPNYVTHEQFLVAQIQRMDVSDDQMRREHYKQVVKRKKAQQKADAAKKQQQKHAASSSRHQNPSGVYRSHETSL